MNMDGNNLQNITKTLNIDFNGIEDLVFCFTPDNKQIMILLFNTNFKGREIYLINLDGSIIEVFNQDHLEYKKIKKIQCNIPSTILTLNLP
jgi:hypothetical protein